MCLKVQTKNRHHRNYVSNWQCRPWLLRVYREVVMAFAYFLLGLGKESIWNRRARDTQVVHHLHVCLEVSFEFFRIPQRTYAPRLAEPILKDFILVCLSSDGSKILVQFERPENRRKNARQQCC